MASTEPSLTDLAKQSEFNTLEDRWLEAIEQRIENRDDLLGALEILNKNGKGDQGAALAWTWLATEGERTEPAEVLALGRELILRCGASRELREEILKLYEQVFADRPEISRLIDLSGLSGDKSPRRALRTLDICLNLRVGDHLIGRSSEQVAEVVAIDTDKCLYTVRSKQSEKIMEPDELALKYDPVESNDLRVLSQLHPDKITELLDSDPVTIVVDILKGRQGRIDSDELEHFLTSKFIEPDRWSSWWSKARSALKCCPNVVLEGRNPVIMTYHAEGRSLEDEILPQWSRAETPAQRLMVIETYLREAKSRKTETKPEMIKRMHDDLLARFEAVRKGSPGEALTEALIIDRLAEGAGLGDETSDLVREILNENSDLVGLMGEVREVPLYLRGLEYIRRTRPHDWPEIYARLLPPAPIEGCQAIAKAMTDGGHGDRLTEAVKDVFTDLTNHLDAICWLWRKPLNQSEAVPARELLIMLLNHLAELTRNENTPVEILRDARLKIRSALSASKYAHYKEVISGMEVGLALTIHRLIERLDGLGQVVRSDLLKLIRETHPQGFDKVRIDPWTDEGMIFCTHEGFNRRKEELNHLLNVKIPQNAKAIGEAASRGDLSENSEYKFALEERDLLHARAAKIRNELLLANFLTAKDISTDQVNIGTCATLRGIDGESSYRIIVLGPWEGDVEKGIYNYRAPLCLKIRGLRVGDAVDLNLDGSERRYRIETIANALEKTI